MLKGFVILRAGEDGAVFLQTVELIVGVMWHSFKPVLAHASCVSSTLLASVKSVNT